MRATSGSPDRLTLHRRSRGGGEQNARRAPGSSGSSSFCRAFPFDAYRPATYLDCHCGFAASSPQRKRETPMAPRELTPCTKEEWAAAGRRLNPPAGSEALRLLREANGLRAFRIFGNARRIQPTPTLDRMIVSRERRSARLSLTFRNTTGPAGTCPPRTRVLRTPRSRRRVTRSRARSPGREPDEPAPPLGGYQQSRALR